MKAVSRDACGAKMKRNGHTSSGSQRWGCMRCGASAVVRYDKDTKDLKEFLDWLLSRKRQIDMPGQGRSFRRRTKRFWDVSPLPDVVDEINRIIYVDGIYLTRNIVILIACSEEHVLSWYLTLTENSHAWEALLSRIAPPWMVVCDGGSGFVKALKTVWPHTAVQRCIFHAFSQVRRMTTTRPRLQAGRELYQLAKDLLVVKSLEGADIWIEHFFQWCEFWEDFLMETTFKEGRREYTHERLRQARRRGPLFTYPKSRFLR